MLQTKMFIVAGLLDAIVHHRRRHRAVVELANPFVRLSSARA